MIQGLYGKQIQSQKMSVQQIMTMKMLSLKSMDLREEILKEVENNPALEIKFDPLSSNARKSGRLQKNSLSAFNRTTQHAKNER